MAISYKQTKPTGSYDYIIIGSGLGGSSLAAILSKEGKRCLVLERHYTPGGFTHTFKRRNYEWDVGVHYVGQVHREGSFLDRAFNYITEDPIVWAEMDEVYDRMVFGEKSFDYRKGPKEFIEQMKIYFPSPKDQTAIDTYSQEVKNAVRSARGLFTKRAFPPMINRLAGGIIGRKANPYAHATTRHILERITGNEELIGVLTGQYGDYGLPPGRSSFLMHAILTHHYMHGGAYPAGGSGRIFDAIEPVIESEGGEVYTNAEVESVLIKKGKAFGVKMIDGTEILAPSIVSSIGIHNTYQKLVPEVSASRKLLAIKPSIGHLCLYIGLPHGQDELQLPKTNFWIYPDHFNHDENMNRYQQDPEQADLPVAYVSFPSAKDPQWEQRYPGRSTIEIITLGQFDQFTDWKDQSWKKRGPEYEQLKARVAHRLLQKLYKYLPHLEGKIDYYELSTPLSTRHFTNYSTGEIYGLEHSPERFMNRQISVHTPVKNLYLTGQDIVSCGVAGALMSGIITSMVLTGRKSIAWIMEG